MKKLFVPGLFLFLGIFSVSAQNLPSVHIINNTGYTVYYIYISPSESEDWGEDCLGDEAILSDGETFTVRLQSPLSSIDTYDIYIEDEDGDTYSKSMVKIRNNDRIEFTSDDLDF
jgi:hypothetical protein